VCALPAYAASDAKEKNAAVDPHAAKKVTAEPQPPKAAAAPAWSTTKKAVPTDLHAARKVATAEANASAKSAGADAHTSAAKAAAPTADHGSPATKGDRTTLRAVTPSAADPHAPKPAASPHAPKEPSATAAHAPAHSPAQSAPRADAEKLPIATDLRALNDRIQERLAEVRKGQASKPSSRSKPAGSRHIPAAASTPRIELVWRPSLTWPQELYAGAAASAPQMPVATDRVSVAWGPQP
jgi:hypothetical protein